MSNRKKTIDSHDECLSCKATCCKHVQVEIDAPTSKNDYEDLRWLVAHKKVIIECVDKEWYVGFKTRCEHLDRSNHCKAYSIRPAICKKHDPETCDKTGTEEEVTYRFTTLKEIDIWLKKNIKWYKKKK